MTTLTIALTGTKAGCPPISCGKGEPIAMELAPASINKSSDGAGWLVGVITEAPISNCPIGISDWTYVITFPETEFSTEFLAGQLGTLSPADLNTGTGAIGLCCLNCGILMILDRMISSPLNNIKRESFRIHSDKQPIEVKSTRLFRMHSTLLITAIEASVEEHLTGYPYAGTLGNVDVNLLSTPGQQTGPASVLSALAATIDPSSTTPLTARREFVPALELPSGAALFANVSSTDPEAHLGLEVHVDFKVKK